MIYLDNAATSYPKPPSVYRALGARTAYLGGNPSRGGHVMAQHSSEEVFLCRSELADFFAVSPENVVFTLNATHAINLAIKGIARPGDHFIISNLEHNAVLRPIVSVCDKLGCRYDVANVVQKYSKRIIEEIEGLIRDNTRAIVMLHASNICSFKLPIREIGELCKRRGIIFILDASQSAGHTEINMKKDNISLLCAPAHKGLFGCMGLGFLISDGSCKLKTLIEGGSGYMSAEPYMPEDLPERLEAGTLPVPAIAALREGLKAVRKRGLYMIEEHERRLYEMMTDRLSSLPFVKQYMTEYRGPCLLFNVIGASSAAIDEELSRRNVCIRSGFHCAALAHKALGTGDFGAVRCSFGMYTTEKDIDLFVQALKEAVASINSK